MKNLSVKKLALAGMFCALAVVGSVFSFPIFGSKCAPVQHMVNILCAVLLGPYYGVGVAFVASLLRNLLGLGSLMAFPGSMFGALLCGLTYHKAKQLLPTLVAEVFGTSILGGLCAYPVAILLMGKSAGDIAFYAYIIPFLVSTAGGAVIAGVLDGSISMEVWNGLALAGGAATVGCCCNMLGFAVISYPDNGVGGLVAQGLGTSMLQVPNLMRKPVLWIPPVLTSAILGPVATCIFQLRNNGAAISSGMGTAGLVGPIGIITGWSNMPKGYAPGAFDWVGMILVCFILPVALSWAIGKFMRKKGWIKEGDLKVDLG